MNQYQFVRYPPYVGPLYGRQSVFALRLLIVGHSHYRYEGCTDDARFTETVFREFAQGKRGNPFAEKVSAAVLGKETPDDADYRRFWESVAVYNYVRRLLEPGTRAKLRDLNDRKAEHAFTEIIAFHRPHCILVFSMMVWKYLPDFDYAGSEAENVGREAGWYKTPQGGVAFAVVLPHPSVWNRARSSEQRNPRFWHGFIKKALVIARERCAVNP